MRRGWLVRLANGEGRALARAFAALLFLGVFVSGLHGGFAAAPGVAAGVLCNAAAGGSGPSPAADHQHDCCLPGAAHASPPAPAMPGSAVPAAGAFLPPPEGQVPPVHGLLTRAGPRAPPSLPA